MKRLYIQTYGCQMNQYDSERIARVLGRVDYVATESIENADLILLNTCSVRDKAEQKVYSSLGRWKELKEQREGVVIGVGGCLAQQEGERLLEQGLPVLATFAAGDLTSSARTTGDGSLDNTRHGAGDAGGARWSDAVDGDTHLVELE